LKPIPRLASCSWYRCRGGAQFQALAALSVVGRRTALGVGSMTFGGASNITQNSNEKGFSKTLGTDVRIQFIQIH
jgi:hypothetical protein